MRRGAVALVLGGLTVIVAASFAPWVRTGQVRRSSYEMVAVARRLGVVSSAPLAAVVRAWVLVPLLAALALAAVVAGRPRFATLPALAVAASTIALANALNSAPVHAEGAVGLALGGAFMTVTGSAGLVLAVRHRQPPGEPP